MLDRPDDALFLWRYQSATPATANTKTNAPMTGSPNEGVVPGSVVVPLGAVGDRTTLDVGVVCPGGGGVVWLPAGGDVFWPGERVLWPVTAGAGVFWLPAGAGVIGPPGEGVPPAAGEMVPVFAFEEDAEYHGYTNGLSLHTPD